MVLKRYEDDPSLSWEERYKRLEAHHREETEALIALLPKPDETQSCGCTLGTRVVTVTHCGGHGIPEVREPYTPEQRKLHFALIRALQSVPKSVKTYLRWKSGRTDHYGRDLLDYLVAHLDRPEEMPTDEHLEGWKFLKGLPYKEQVGVIKKVLGREVEGGWPPD